MTSISAGVCTCEISSSSTDVMSFRTWIFCNSRLCADLPTPGELSDIKSFAPTPSSLYLTICISSSATREDQTLCQGSSIRNSILQVTYISGSPSSLQLSVHVRPVLVQTNPIRSADDKEPLLSRQADEGKTRSWYINFRKLIAPVRPNDLFSQWEITALRKPRLLVFDS